MSTHFQKKAKSEPSIPLASMSDIVFILIIFFMVTTVLREQTVQVRALLPQAEALTKIEQKRLVSYIYVGPLKLGNNQLGETAIQIDDALIENMTSIRNVMYNKLLEQPKLIVSLRVDGSSEMGVVTDVQQELREAGTLRINYSSREESPR